MELGSEFSLTGCGEVVHDSIFHYLSDFHSIYTDSGRSAIRLIEQTISSGPVLLPSYICDSVCSCFPNRPLWFYRMDENLGIDWEDFCEQLKKGPAIVYLHYFNGLLPSDDILEWLRMEKEKGNFTVIEDTTHSIFSAPMTVGDYAICSLRKWFPIPDGGVLYGRNPLPVKPPHRQAQWVSQKKQAMEWKRLYLRGEMGEYINPAYRRLFIHCDHALDCQTDVFALSSSSKAILHGCSVEAVRTARRNNYQQLQRRLGRITELQPLCEPDDKACPLTFSVKVELRDCLRSYLIEHKVFCAVHWPVQGTPME